MSKTRQILEISSPTVKNRHERVRGLVQQCNYCCGNGWFWGQDFWGEAVKVPCPLCNGAGKMQPHVSIDWTPVSDTDSEGTETTAKTTVKT